MNLCWKPITLSCTAGARYGLNIYTITTHLCVWNIYSAISNTGISVVYKARSGIEIYQWVSSTERITTECVLQTEYARFGDRVCFRLAAFMRKLMRPKISFPFYIKLHFLLLRLIFFGEIGFRWTPRTFFE